MDHSHHDRTYKKSRFQQELEQSVSRKLISSLLLGCLLFCIAIAVVNALNQNARREDHLESVTSTFHEVYNNTSAFLLDAGHTELFLSELRNDQDNLRYLISQYNVSALVEIQLILTDSKGNVRFTTFSEGEMNLHRQEFNCIAVDNACHLMRAVYTTVYHFRANSSEYVMIHPLYRDGEYQGAAAVYLNENDWTKLFSQYQYDAILTKPNGDVIACSNSSFLSQKNANKYLPADAAQYVRVNGNRYLRSSRSLENGTVLAYSFIYSPTNYSYLFVGLLLIVLLGLSWAAMFARIMHAMTEQMVKSVDTLVREIRIIRKEDPDHIIEIDTGDEIDEIARQVNKMVRSIQELSQRNIALAEVNNRMEMQNLQAQINPHFIYNTLDNIRYLIPTDPQRAQQLIGRFIGILRYSINNTKHNVPVKDDLKYLQDYLVIQSTRFGANFSYEIDIDDACMEFIIPKLLLQPLLENSIKYGFQKKPCIHIRVRGWLEEDALYFTVEDNGGGVDETMLEQLRDILRSDEVNIEHNGLQNINRRIWLGYGGDSGLTIDSTEGEGFTVKLKLRLGGM
jgi:two-component system sensor histidine kinase YesM